MRRAVLLVLSMMLLATLACEFDFSTANLSNIRLATDADGNNRTTTFLPTDTVYVVFDINDAAADTAVQAVWYLVEAEGDIELYRSETLETSDAKVHFNLSVDDGFAEGQYKVEVWLEGVREQTLNLAVVAPPIFNERLATDASGNNRAIIFNPPPDTIYMAFHTNPNIVTTETPVQVVWYLVEETGDTEVSRSETPDVISTGRYPVLGAAFGAEIGLVTEGLYKVEILREGELDKTLNFEVVAPPIFNERLATDGEGTALSTTFAYTDTIYVLFETTPSKVSADTPVQVVWYLVEESGDIERYRTEAFETTDLGYYATRNSGINADGGFVADGQYRVEILRDGELDKTLNFEVVAPPIFNERLATDAEGNESASTFAPTDTIYVVFETSPRQISADTPMQVVWYLVEETGDTELYRIESETLGTGDYITRGSSFSTDDGLAEGQYKVEIWLEGQPEQTLNFEVVAPEAE